jgi:hypothetical protein
VIKETSFFDKARDFLSLFFFFIYKYVFGIKQEKKLFFRIFFLLFLTHVFCIFVHALAHGLLYQINSDLSQGYGDIYVEFEKKLFLKEFEEKKIIDRIKKQKGIDSFFAYGSTNALILKENDQIPVIILTFLFDSQDNFFSYRRFSQFDFTKQSVYGGITLYKKLSTSKEKMQLGVITEQDHKKNCFFYDSMPIKNIVPGIFNWDEWNDKALIFNIKHIERYFEIPTISSLNIYVKDFSQRVSVLDFLKNEFKSEIGYISFSKDIFPEYHKYISLIERVSSIIIFLIMIFSGAMLSVLIEFYIVKNIFHYVYLRMLGCKTYFIIFTNIVFFLLTYILSLILATIAFFLLRKGLYFSQLLLVDVLTNTLIVLDVSYSFYFFYFLCGLIFNFFVSFFFLKKYNR